MLITDLIAEIWDLLPAGFWWALGVLTVIVVVALRAEAH